VSTVCPSVQSNIQTKVGIEHWWNGNDRGRSNLYCTYRLSSYGAVNLHRPDYANRDNVLMNITMKHVRASIFEVEKQ
jgi:hypothetical protein